MTTNVTLQYPELFGKRENKFMLFVLNAKQLSRKMSKRQLGFSCQKHKRSSSDLLNAYESQDITLVSLFILHGTPNPLLIQRQYLSAISNFFKLIFLRKQVATFHWSRGFRNTTGKSFLFALPKFFYLQVLNICYDSFFLPATIQLHDLPSC